MPRKRCVAQREILPDPKYHSKILSQFINVVMLNGKKSVAEKIVYQALKLAQQMLDKKHDKQEVSDEDGRSGTGSAAGTDSRSLVIFEQALENVSPAVEVR